MKTVVREGRLSILNNLLNHRYLELLSRLTSQNVNSYKKRLVLSATIHPDIKRTLVSMSKRTGMSVSQVADEVLYTGLIQMQELDAWG